MFPIKLCYMVIVLLATSALLAQCALDPGMSTDSFADNSEDKNADVALTLHKRPSFFVGSRYGRSGATAPVFATSKARRLNVVPRNDRFFLGSRYGKRSGEFMSPYEQDTVAAAAAADDVAESALTAANLHTYNKSTANSASAPYMMSCVYTGLKNLYRCNNIEEINSIIHQLTTAQSDDDSK